MKIALIVDNPFRDLPGLVLVALHLCQHGHTCFLVPSSLRPREILTLVPDFVLLNNLRIGKESFARQMAEIGIGLGVLDNEGGVFRSMEQYAETLTPDAAVRDSIACLCTWGPKLASHAVAEGWFRESQIRVTGTPRMDFYADPWREAALNMHWAAEGGPAPLVLINSNFSLANPMHHSGEAAATMKAQRWGFDPIRVARLLEAERRAMAEMVALANRLAMALPDVNFVYRPHPFEDPGAYATLLDSRPNLRMEKSGTVDGWILRSRAVIQRGCSTAIEATVAGVPALSPGWIEAPVDFETVDAVSIFCTSPEEMIDQVRRAANDGIEQSGAVANRLRCILGDWFLTVDGLAYQRVVTAILDAAGKRQQAASPQRCLDALDGILRHDAPWSARARSFGRRAMGLSINWSFRDWRETADLSWDRDQRFFDAAEVRSLVDVLQPVARTTYAGRWAEVPVQASLERGDYHFDYRHGRSVTLAPVQN